MTIAQDLLDRSDSKCELCSSNENLAEFIVVPKDDKILVCGTCKEQLDDTSKVDETHWHCLNDSMWSEVDAVKVVVYRMLSTLKNQDLLDMMYLEDEVLQWAKDGIEEDDEDALIYRDSNGVILEKGDTVVILKDLPVKGAGFTAKQGTAVRNISLARGDETHIEGRVNGVKVQLKTCFLKKS